ncbi:hypothetical protein [Magnetospirillum sp. 15-1]|uniref:hypothetical protein n=1 Tax=Magnetospirillum sp. 15-1 TaxID=1979370 RepID=UPI001142D1CA|nr:hypothetical protein [Magnetospirillum sp. 15-1]
MGVAHDLVGGQCRRGIGNGRGFIVVIACLAECPDSDEAAQSKPIIPSKKCRVNKGAIRRNWHKFTVGPVAKFSVEQLCETLPISGRYVVTVVCDSQHSTCINIFLKKGGDASLLLLTGFVRVGARKIDCNFVEPPWVTQPRKTGIVVQEAAYRDHKLVVVDSSHGGGGWAHWRILRLAEITGEWTSARGRNVIKIHRSIIADGRYQGDRSRYYRSKNRLISLMEHMVAEG